MNPSLTWTIGIVFSIYGLIGDSQYPLAWTMAGAVVLAWSYGRNEQ